MTKEESQIKTAASSELVRYGNSSQIARMREDWTRDASFMDARGLIHPSMKEKSVLDAFRNLRTRLLENGHGQNPVTLVSSVGRSSDSSLVALNLAISFALDSAKTALIVDCHINRPCLDAILSVKPHRGLTDYLVNQDLNIGTVLCQTGIPRLRLVPAGMQTETGVEYFTSLRMQDFLQGVQKRYPDRFVILSAPPLDSAADSRILSGLCDQALLVANYGRVDENRLLDTANILGREKLAGVVINRVPRAPFLS